MSAKYQLFRSEKSEQFYFRLKAGNGEVILASQGYSSKQAAENGIASVQTNCADESNYEKKESTNNKPYFVLKARNGQVIGKSELYESTQGRDNGIASVQKNGATTVIEEV